MAKSTIQNNTTYGAIRGQLNEMFGNLYNNMWWRILNKPDDQPIFIVFTGQSNCEGTYKPQAGPYVQNNNVFDWQSPSAATFSQGTFSFVQADPNRVTPAIYLSTRSTTAVTGMIGRGDNALLGDLTYGSGNIGWSCCDLLQKITGRDVYMLTTHWTGQAITRWADGAECEAELNSQLTDASGALAALSGFSITAPDAVIWMQGESDLYSGRTADEYAADWMAFKTLAESKWAQKDYTHWYWCELANDTIQRAGQPKAQSYPEYSPDATIAIDEDPYVTVVKSKDCAAVYDVAIHYWAEGCEELGKRVAMAMLGAPQPTPRMWAHNLRFTSSRPMVSIEPDGVVNHFYFNTLNNITNAGAFLFKVANAGVEKLSMDKDGNLTITGALKAALGFSSDVATSGTAEAFDFDTTNALTTSGDLLMSLKNQGTAKLTVDKDGLVRSVGLDRTSLGSAGMSGTDIIPLLHPDGTIHGAGSDASGGQWRMASGTVTTSDATETQIPWFSPPMGMSGNIAMGGLILVNSRRTDANYDSYCKVMGFSYSYQGGGFTINYQTLGEGQAQNASHNSDSPGTLTVSSTFKNIIFGTPGVFVTGVASQTWDWSFMMLYRTNVDYTAQVPI
jgi:hypothetical protein